MAPPDDYNAKIEIELLKKDVTIMANLCEKFDTTIDKMQEIAANLSRMVSLQEQRLENQERTSKEVTHIMELRRVEHDNDIKELHSRINTTNRELTKKIEETENKILQELKTLRDELRKQSLDENKSDKSLTERLSAIEAWKYTVVGGLMVATWILAKVDINLLMKAFSK